jgi:hypothetical protein
VLRSQTVHPRAQRLSRGGPQARAGTALVDRLKRELEAAEQVLAQTDLSLRGQPTIPRPARLAGRGLCPPIRMASPRRPTEFGYKARVADTADGLVLVDVPSRGNPGDDGLLDGAITKARVSGMQCAPCTPTAASVRGSATPHSFDTASEILLLTLVAIARPRDVE